MYNNIIAVHNSRFHAFATGGHNKEAAIQVFFRYRNDIILIAGCKKRLSGCGLTLHRDKANFIIIMLGKADLFSDLLN